MKKLSSLLLTLLLALVLGACGAGNTGNDPNVDSPAAGDETPVAPNDGVLGEPGTTGEDGSATDMTPGPMGTTTP